MSFVFAEKFTHSESGKENIQVFCDTRIELPDSAGAHFSNIEKDFIEKYGMIKSTIIALEFCISFAGNNIIYATTLFRRLAEKQIFDRNNVIDLAYSIHMQAESKDDIEFIISCIEDGEFHIDCIKNHNKYLDCASAWIGSPIAFNYFQEKRHKEIFNPCPLHMKTSSAFAETVSGCGDNTVGGFPIEILYFYDSNSFQFVQSKGYSISKTQTVYPGELVKFDLSVANGGYSYEMLPYSLHDVILNIEQMKPAILYSTHIRRTPEDSSNPYLFSLMLPLLAVEDGNGGWKCYK